jgi:hypothetical protein
MGVCGCIGCKSCCDTCCVGAACWDGFGVLADLSIGSVGNGFLCFGCAAFTLTPSMSRASSAIVFAKSLSTSKRTAACSLFVMSRIAFNARCTSARRGHKSALPRYLKYHQHFNFINLAHQQAQRLLQFCYAQKKGLRNTQPFDFLE